jgi:hypothetical protein
VIAPTDAEPESRQRRVTERHQLSTVGVMGLGSHLSRRLAYLQQVWLALIVLMLEPALVWQGSCEGLCSAPDSETELNGVGGLRTTSSSRIGSLMWSLSAVKADNERSSAGGQCNVGDSIRRRDVGGWAAIYRK